MAVASNAQHKVALSNYHGVRQQHAPKYVAAVCRLTHARSRVLIAAGNANEEQHSGPPRVQEADLRADFSPAFEFQWLRTTHFDTVSPQGQGALAWSILLRRK